MPATLEASPAEAALVRSMLKARWAVAAAATIDPAEHDPVVLARRCGIEPDPWQIDVLRSTAKRRILLASRQSGKSTTTAVLALHRILYRPNALVLMLSPSLRQSGELFKKALGLYHASGDIVPAASETALSLTLTNGSRIVSLPGTEGTIRGYSGASLIIEDEASRVLDTLYEAIRPMLATSDGDLVLLSTPFGQRGHFWNAWEHGGDVWERTRVTATDCPRIPAEFLAEERAQLGDLAYRSEYLVEFCDTVESVFASELIHAAIDDTLAPLWGG